MHKIDSSTAVPNMPAPTASAGGGWFAHGSAGGTPYTILTSDWANAVQAELMNVILGAGISLDKSKQDQLLTALNKMYVARETITKPTTINVNATTGNDANDGRSPGAPLKTVQAAINAVYSRYDWNGQTCTIQLADGTYTNSAVGGWVGAFNGNPIGIPFGGLTIQGNSGNPAAVVINAVNSNGIIINQGFLNVNGLTFQATGNVNNFTQIQGYGLYSGVASYMVVNNCKFASCGSNQLEAGNVSIIALSSGCTFTGTATNSIVCDVGGQIWMPGQTITVSGLNTTNFCVAANGGLITIQGCTFVGSATGTRYLALQNGLITTNGAGPNYLPGNAPGAIYTQGQYL